jgi:hypothetical protein
MIEKLYKEWFGISKQAEELIAQGKTKAANKLMRDFDVKVSKDIDTRKKIQFKLKLGKHLNMTVHSQRPELEDPIKRGFFDMPPVGYTYMQYMEGYITEMVAHELGHNLGLRHNFKGNLGAYESNEKGSVSRSIMEYLGRAYRHKSDLGLYDKMAIAYGYKGIRPKHKDWFCTDEDQGNDAASMKIASPECSSSDATSDPFSYFEARLGKVLDLLLESKSDSAPVWKLQDMKTQFNDAITGIAFYAISAENTADSWTNFFGKADRPDDKSEIKPYVLKRIKKKLCNPANSVLIASKESPEAQKIAADNLAAFAKAITDKTSELGIYTAEELKCEE